MTTPLVNASKHDGVLVLELNHPPANTYSYEMMRELDAHILDARMDDSVHILILTGAPPPPDSKKATGFFCAGADIEMPQKSALLQVQRGAVTIRSGARRPGLRPGGSIPGR